VPEIHSHDLRHAVGTLSAQQGATGREIMARLGHRSGASSDRYQPAAERHDAQPAAKLDEAARLARAKVTPRSARQFSSWVEWRNPGLINVNQP
jgi:hypothetical protein